MFAHRVTRREVPGQTASVAPIMGRLGGHRLDFSEDEEEGIPVRGDATWREASAHGSAQFEARR